MLLKQLLELYEILDSPKASGQQVKDYLLSIDPDAEIFVYPLVGPKGHTDMVKVFIPGTRGKTAVATASGGDTAEAPAPTLGILGRLGGLGARPERIGFVSDGDGALAALTVAAKLLDMRVKGDVLEGDILISTHVCPDAPVRPHHPVPFMDSPVETYQVNQEEVSDELDAILSVDTTKGNRIINTRGIAITPTVKEGYLLPLSDDLMDIMEITTGKLPQVLALSTYDITPYGNDLYHLNSILQPSTASKAPAVGVAIVTETAVPGCATGASHYADVEEAARFLLEVAKAYTAGQCQFYDVDMYERALARYGSMSHIQTMGL
ncbi:MAG: DUF1177 domain-containing protein [Firmicutes bacterium]|nr:DUF1177 domain-containing protein [Bacillota bacterium]